MVISGRAYNFFFELHNDQKKVITYREFTRERFSNCDELFISKTQCTSMQFESCCDLRFIAAIFRLHWNALRFRNKQLIAIAKSLSCKSPVTHCCLDSPTYHTHSSQSTNNSTGQNPAPITVCELTIFLIEEKWLVLVGTHEWVLSVSY